MHESLSNYFNLIKHILLLSIYTIIYYYLISNYLIGILAMLSNKFKKAPLFLFITIICLKSQLVKWNSANNLNYNSVVSRSLSSCISMIYVILPIILILNKKRTYYEPRVMYTSYVFSFIGILIHLKCLVNQFTTQLFIYTLIFTIFMFLMIIYVDLPNAFLPVIGHTISGNQSTSPPLDRTDEQIERSEVSETSYLKQITDFLFGNTLNYKQKYQLETILIHSFFVFLIFFTIIAIKMPIIYFIYISISYIIIVSFIFILFYNFEYIMPILYSFLITFLLSIFFQIEIIKTIKVILDRFNFNEVTKDLIFYGFSYNLSELILGLNLINVRETEMAVYLIFVSYTINLLTTPIITNLLNFNWTPVEDLPNYTRVITICFFIVSMFITSISFEGSRSKLTKELGISLILTYILYLLIIFIQNKYGYKYFIKNKPIDPE